MYSNKIFEIFKNPSNAGGLQGANGIGKYIDEVCGDFVKIYLKIDDNQKIVEARFKTMGSVGTIVASSVICGLVSGVTLAEAQEFTAEDILEVTGEYPVDKMYSLDFAIRGLNLAIADYYQRIEKEEKPKRKKSDKAEKTPKSKNADLIEEDIYNEEEEETFEAYLPPETMQEKEQFVEKAEKETALNQETEEIEQEDLFEDDSVQSSYLDEEELPTADLSLDELEEEENDEEDNDEEDNDEDFFGDVAPYGDEEVDDKPTTIYQDMPSNTLDPVDLFLRGGNDADLEIHNLSNGDRISITTVEEPVNFKATKMVEDARSYTPVIETKIIKDEDMKNLTKETKKQNIDGDNKVSKAKAMFDAMFEE